MAFRQGVASIAWLILDVEIVRVPEYEFGFNIEGIGFRWNCRSEMLASNAAISQ